MKTVAVSVAVFLAKVDKPSFAAAEHFGVGSLRHEVDPPAGDIWNARLQNSQGFGRIVLGRDDELDLVGVRSDPFREDSRLISARFVSPDPSWIDASFLRGRVADLKLA